MKNLPTLLLLLIFSSSLLAQEPLKKSGYVQIGSFADKKNHQTRVFGDKVNVRIAPNKDAQVVTQLLAGEPVTILSSASEQFTQNGWTTNWVKIGFEKNGKRQDGYVWGGVLGFHALQAGDVSFVYAVVKKEGNETEGSEKYRVEIRAIRQQQIISSVTTTIGIGAGYDTEAALYGNLGMKAYQNVIRLDFSFGACGYNQYEVCCLWDGAKLLMLPALSSVSEAGLFSYSENYLFPKSKDGMPEVLLFQVEQTEGMIEDGNYSYTQRLRQMIWNGKVWEKTKSEDDGEH